MKHKAISEVANIEAKKTSRLVFESLYSAMQRGWTKDDLKEIIGRLNTVDENMKINVYRSDIVANLYGDIDSDKKARNNIDEVKKAMSGFESLNIVEDSNINYYYPVTAKNNCLKCHTNAKIGDTLGVINIFYPITELKVSLTYMVNFFIIFMSVFSLVIFLAIFFELDKYIIKPIKDFSNKIKNITSSNDIKQRIDIEDKIYEIDSIKDVFNSMLDSIEYQFYNDPLTGLKNRKRLIEQLERKETAALMIINIDSFQEINDLYGDESGDNILIEFANFLKDITPNESKLFRLHSDEFAYLCEDGLDIKDIINYATDMSEKINKKIFHIDSNGEINISATIGISYGSDMLLPNADTALIMAKKRKKTYFYMMNQWQCQKSMRKTSNGLKD